MAKNAKPAAKQVKGGEGTPNGTASAGSPQSSDETSAPKSTPGLAVSSNVDGFRRAGRAWTKAPTTVACADLTQTQIDQLMQDPELRVDLVDLPLQPQDA